MGLNSACNDARRVMFDIRSSGPWTPLAFYMQGGRIGYRRFREDSAGVRVAFAWSL